LGNWRLIKEIRTYEKIEEGNREEISEKKLKTINEERQNSNKMLPQPHMSNLLKKGTDAGKETNVKKTNKK